MLYNVKRIVPMRSMKRDKRTGEMMVRVIWAVDGSTTFEPLSNFYNGDFFNSEMDTIIKEYKKTAMEYPFRNRHCLMCDEKVNCSMIFCRRRSCSVVKSLYE